MNANHTTVLASTLLEYRNVFKMYHWSTLIYARHIASCAFIDKLDTIIDKIIETYSARYGRPNGATTIDIPLMNDKDASNMLQIFVAFLVKEFPTYLQKQDTDLLNLRDELLNEVNQQIYLYALK
jgi:hypothetical protein